jgi:hypothetical protein
MQNIIISISYGSTKALKKTTVNKSFWIITSFPKGKNTRVRGG